MYQKFNAFMNRSIVKIAIIALIASAMAYYTLVAMSNGPEVKPITYHDDNGQVVTIGGEP